MERNVYEIEFDGAAYWVSATSSEEAIALAYATCDEDPENSSCVMIRKSRALNVELHNADQDNMWEAHIVSVGPAVLGSTEWL